MEILEIEQLYSEICEDINEITVNYFTKLNKVSYSSVYNFIKVKPKIWTDLRFLKSLNKYHKIIYGYDNKKILSLIK